MPRTEPDLTMARVCETVFGTMIRTAKIADMPMGPTVGAVGNAFAMFLALTSIQAQHQAHVGIPVDDVMKDLRAAYDHYVAQPAQIADVMERMQPHQ